MRGARRACSLGSPHLEGHRIGVRIHESEDLRDLVLERTCHVLV